jgi:ketosteroid isomerase-like protein
MDESTAYEAIRQLAARYAIAIDSRDLDALVSCFVDDVQVRRDAFGRDALRAVFAEQLRAIGVSILNVGTHRIELVDADHARGLVYCHAQIEDGDRWIHQQILYRDTYERRGREWFFVRRVHELFYGEEAPSNPMRQRPANWPEHHDGRGTAPMSFPTWDTFWRES